VVCRSQHGGHSLAQRSEQGANVQALRTDRTCAVWEDSPLPEAPGRLMRALMYRARSQTALTMSVFVASCSCALKLRLAWRAHAFNVQEVLARFKRAEGPRAHSDNLCCARLWV